MRSAVKKTGQIVGATDVAPTLPDGDAQMDQQALRKIENRCIQEQPAWCIAACPLHVDARTFIRHVSNEKWDEAWKVLRKTMPFPGILGRICDAPCQKKCKRSEAGGPIEIGALERACVSHPPPPRRIQPLPARNHHIAVMGSGLSGLTAAWDLARKGYRVDIFDAAPMAAYLLSRYPDMLSEAIIGAELSLLENLGVTHHREAAIHEAAFMEKCRSDFHAVFLSLEVTDPVLGTEQEGIFTGGEGESPVRHAAQGRWAATSIDRFLQNTSLTAGREKEGPHDTRLYTRLTGIISRPPTPFSFGDRYTPEEARMEASRCLQCECLECVKVCPYLEAFKGYPKKYAREIYNNESIVMGSRLANKLVNSCSLCGLCQAVCPENFAMQDLCLQARQSMVRRDKMPPSAHEFALLDMEFSQGEHFHMARCEPGMEKTSFVFFPGCQLSATRPDQTASIYDHLRGHLDGGVGLMLGCCGAPAHWAGRETLFRQQVDRFRQDRKILGKPRVIAACATCRLMLKENLPETDIISIWEVLSNTIPPQLQFRPKTPLAIHDPCTTRDDEKSQSAVRRLLDHLDIPFTELELGRDKTECCGFGGLMQNANPALAREVVNRRAVQSEADYLAYCAMCRDSLAGVGKRVIHPLDLFFPLGDGDPASLPRIGWSARQENRARLKARLLKKIWGEEFGRMKPHQSIRLNMDPGVRELLDRRRILDEDIQKVLHHAMETGDRLFHPETGRYKASFNPYKTTFWIEYSQDGDGYKIHNAYAHRMEVVAP